MVVQTGPFAGLRMHDAQTWGNGEDIGPQLLGVYEAELHDAVWRGVARAPTTVVNVGCAEGYYAIGLARLLPGAQVLAFDIDRQAQAACRANAVLNGVEHQVEVNGACSPARLARIARADRNILAVIDCEGFEKSLLDDPRSQRALRRADLIIETHDFQDREITPAILAGYAGTHEAARIPSGARNPHRFSFLDRWSDADKWLLVCENRPELQMWIALWSRAAHDTA